MQFTINLNDSHSVNSRNTACAVDVTKLSADIIGRLALHGLTQKIADAAASAMADAGFKGQKFDDLAEADQKKVQSLALEAMNAVRDTLIAGEWSERREGGASVSPVQVAIRDILRKRLVAAMDASAKATWKELDTAARNAKLDALFAKQNETAQAAITKAAEAQVEIERAAKAQAAKLSIGDIEL